MNRLITYLLLLACAISNYSAHAASQSTRDPTIHGFATWQPSSQNNFGDVLWFDSFDCPATVKGTYGDGVIIPWEDRTNVLSIENFDQAKTAIRYVPLPIRQLRGKKVSIGADIRAQSVSAKFNPTNGIKCAIRIELPSGASWRQFEISSGSFDWYRFVQRVSIPQNARAASLVLGLELVRGKVFFDNLRISFLDAAAPTPAARANVPIFRGHSEPRLRGTMIDPDSITEGDLRELAYDWGANVVRWQLTRHTVPPGETGLDAWNRWFEGQLKKLDTWLNWAGSMGVKVVVDIHSPPGGGATSIGYQAAIRPFWYNRQSQERFVEIWREMAARYKGDDRIWGFDILNEPYDPGIREGCYDWQHLAAETAAAIRSIDPNRTIIIEPPNWGLMSGFEDFKPIPLPNIVYSFHMYAPMQYTSQGVFGPSDPVSYPGVINGVLWDKAQLERVMQPAATFARKYRVHMFVGEFSTPRWAPGGDRFLSDAIDIFESHGWDWTYHAFREWDGWSVEHSSDKNDFQRTAQPTARKQVLLKWMRQNRPQAAH